MIKNRLTRQMRSDSQKVRRSYLPMQFLIAGDLQRQALGNMEKAEY